MSKETNHFEEEYREPTARKIGEEPSVQENAEVPVQDAPAAPIADAPAAEAPAEPVGEAPAESAADASVKPAAEAPAESATGAETESAAAETPDLNCETCAEDAAAGETAGANKLLGEMPKERKRWSTKKKVALGAGIAAVAVACAFGFVFLFGTGSVLAGDDLQQIMDDGTYYTGVSIAGVDLSGKTAETARAEVQAAEDAYLESISLEYTVDTDSYSLDAQQLGAAVNIDAALKEAMIYGRQGTFAERTAAINEAKTKGVQIDVPVTYNKETILASLKANDEKINVPAQDAAVEVVKTQDEGTMMTGTTITLKDEVVGKEVDNAALADQIYAQLEQGETTSVAATTSVTQPKYTKAQLEGRYTMLGTYKTDYDSSAEGRRYNIWKMADAINGVKIMPGETWSINEQAGPRSYALGWKPAPGIADGKYQDEPGGGICQTSSTLYNAILRAEVEIVDRSHHSWPLNYVPGGLDATISTGAPDFVIKNNYDIPIFIIANCDGKNRNIEISVYGPKFEDGMTRDFTSKEVGGSPAGEQIIEDPSLPAGTRVVERSSHPRRVFDVYKHWKDASGNIVKTEKYSTETYQAFNSIVRVGTKAPDPTPAPNPTPQPPAPTPVPEQTPQPPAPETPAA